MHPSLNTLSLYIKIATYHLHNKLLIPIRVDRLFDRLRLVDPLSVEGEHDEWIRFAWGGRMRQTENF